MSLAEQVANLLVQSHAAHLEAKECRQKKDRAGNLARLKEARAHRLAAHALDPEHTVPAWAEEQRHTPNVLDTHAEMLRFYNHQIARADA